MAANPEGSVLEMLIRVKRRVVHDFESVIPGVAALCFVLTDAEGQGHRALAPEDRLPLIVACSIESNQFLVDTGRGEEATVVDVADYLQALAMRNVGSTWPTTSRR